MEAALANALRLLQLALPAAFGALAGRVGLFPKPRIAIDVLNRYALHVGFPALIAYGLFTSRAALPTSVWFWALWPITLCLLLGVIRLFPFPRGEKGTLALVASFGNIAYLGLPYVVSLYGTQISAPAAIAVSMHITGAVILGPALLARWSGKTPVPWPTLGVQVAKMPLFWSPWVGAASHLLPREVRFGLGDWIGPVAKSAAPVALFLLGLQVYQERQKMVAFTPPLFRHLAIRQVLAPTLMLALALGATSMGGLSSDLAKVHVMLAAMPLGVATFSMAHQARVGPELVTAALVWSSLLALVLLPLWSVLAGLVLV